MPKPVHRPKGTYRILQGDCRKALLRTPAASFDSVVTDPPYDLEFMRKTWDGTGVAFDKATWYWPFRALKPGGYMLAFGGTRTYHRMVCAIEDAGFEIVDCLMWLYGTGFPKGKTCLKPAWEPIVLACRPGKRVLPLEIDAARIPTESGYGWRYGTSRTTPGSGRTMADGWTGEREGGNHPNGRWPANVVHNGSDEVMEAFAAFGERGGGFGKNGDGSGTVRRRMDFRMKATGEEAGYGDTGTAARFFYCAKASRAEREKGCESLPDSVLAMSNGAQSAGEDYANDSDIGLNRVRTVKNFHPTVKPIALMRWLVRLVTPPGGKVLDPFAGSGSTLVASLLEGMNPVGVEENPEYLPIIRARIAGNCPRAKEE